jgi:hypothetical protein
MRKVVGAVLLLCATERRMVALDSWEQARLQHQQALRGSPPIAVSHLKLLTGVQVWVSIHTSGLG